MLIKESQLRAIIREELIREHQELMLEFNIKNIFNKAPKAIPALILMLSAGSMAACDDIQSTTPEKLSAQKASIAIGLEPDPSLEISLDSADTVEGIQQISDEGKKACKNGIKYLKNKKVENPELLNQLKRSISTLEKMDDLLKPQFLPKNGAEEIINNVNDNGISICKNLNDFIQDGYFE